MTEENPEFTETVELTETDEADLLHLFGEDDGKPNVFRPILYIWREVLAPAGDELEVKPTPQWCSRIVASYPLISYVDMYTYRDLYYSRIKRLGEILDKEIESDEECLTYTTPAEDVEHNSGHYKSVLTDWQLEFLGWEMDWDCLHADSAIDLATISEIHKMFFGDTGLTAYLENIQFEFTEADQAELAQVLTDRRDGVTSE